MYAIGYTSLLTGKYIVGHSRYSDEYTAAEHAAFLSKHYAQRGFKIKHDVVRVDDEPATDAPGAGEPVTGKPVLNSRAAVSGRK